MSASGGPGSRREARERALGLLYEAEAKNEPIHQVLSGLPVPPPPFAVVLLEGVADNASELDQLISRFAVGWSLERMPALDRAALRLGAFELAHLPEVPSGAAISEAVELVGRYSTDESSRFVNGVLAAIARDVRTEQ